VSPGSVCRGSKIEEFARQARERQVRSARSKEDDLGEAEPNSKCQNREAVLRSKMRADLTAKLRSQVDELRGELDRERQRTGDMESSLEWWQERLQSMRSRNASKLQLAHHRRDRGATRATRAAAGGRGGGGSGLGGSVGTEALGCIAESDDAEWEDGEFDSEVFDSEAQSTEVQSLASDEDCVQDEVADRGAAADGGDDCDDRCDGDGEEEGLPVAAPCATPLPPPRNVPLLALAPELGVVPAHAVWSAEVAMVNCLARAVADTTRALRAAMVELALLQAEGMAAAEAAALPDLAPVRAA